MLPRPLVLTVALATTAWAAAETAPIAVAGGVCYRYDRDARAVTDEGGGFSWTEDYGTHFVIGASAPERAFIGYPWLDIDWARSSGAGSRIDTLKLVSSLTLFRAAAHFVAADDTSYEPLAQLCDTTLHHTEAEGYSPCSHTVTSLIGDRS